MIYLSVFSWISCCLDYCNLIASLGEGNGNPLQYSCLENPMDGGAWWAAVQGVAKRQTRLSKFTFTFHALEKEMATHSSVLAWRIPGMGEPSGLPSMGSHRVRHDWSDLAAAAFPPLLTVQNFRVKGKNLITALKNIFKYLKHLTNFCFIQSRVFPH